MTSRYRQRIESAIASYTRVSPAAMSVYWLTAQVSALERVEETLRDADYPEAAQLVNTMLVLTQHLLVEALAGKSPG